MTKREREALKVLRRYVTLQRAALDPPKRARERGYEGFRRQLEPTHRPLAAQIDPDLTESDAWTNDVAESLRIYTESWILPIIDSLIAGDLRSAQYLAQITDRPLSLSEYSAHYRNERKAP